MTSRIAVKDGVARVWAPFELKAIVKSFPGRIWDPDDKCWVVAEYQADGLAQALRVAGEAVYFIEGGNPDRQPPTPSTPETATWANILLTAVGPDHADAVCKAIARTLSPYTSIRDAVLMNQLNAARAAKKAAS